MEQFDNLTPGLSLRRVLTVEKKQTVSHTRVAILSTPAMIALMERVSAELAQSRLPAEYTTVGYEVCVKHKAPAGLGAQLEVWSRLLEVSGRKLLYEVRVAEGETVIGEGSHRRTIIPLR